jgi:hypothetical protein
VRDSDLMAERKLALAVLQKAEKDARTASERAIRAQAQAWLEQPSPMRDHWFTLAGIHPEARRRPKA